MRYPGCWALVVLGLGGIDRPAWCNDLAPMGFRHGRSRLWVWLSPDRGVFPSSVTLTAAGGVRWMVSGGTERESRVCDCDMGTRTEGLWAWGFGVMSDVRTMLG